MSKNEQNDLKTKFEFWGGFAFMGVIVAGLFLWWFYTYDMEKTKIKYEYQLKIEQEKTKQLEFIHSKP